MFLYIDALLYKGLIGNDFIIRYVYNDNIYNKGKTSLLY